MGKGRDVSRRAAVPAAVSIPRQLPETQTITLKRRNYFGSGIKACAQSPTDAILILGQRPK